MPTYACDNCHTRLPTQQGLRSHIQQTPECASYRSRQYAAAAEYSSSDESDGGDQALADGEFESEGMFGDDFGAPNMEDVAMDEVLSTPAEPAAAAAAVNDTVPTKRSRVTIEEVPDEEDERFTEDFPEQFQAGAVFDQCKTSFEKLRAEQKEAERQPWYPFESKEEWELAQWLMTSGLSHSKIDACLKLKAVRI